MKRASKRDDDMASEYDFRGGIRGKYAHRYLQGSNIVVLDPDVAKVFDNARLVNDMLRSLLKIVQPRFK